MNKKLTLSCVTLALWFAGFGLLWYATNWMVVLAIFLLLYANNLQMMTTLEKAFTQIGEVLAGM